MLPYMYMSKVKGHMSKTLSLSFSTNTSHFNVIVYLVEDQFGIKIINNLGIPDKKEVPGLSRLHCTYMVL